METLAYLLPAEIRINLTFMMFSIQSTIYFLKSFYNFPRRRYRALVFVMMSVFFVTACKSSGDRPANVLDHETMVRTLADIYIAEEKVRRLALSSDSTQLVFERLKGHVFEAAQVHDSVFRISMDYYMGHPKEMEQIYTALVDSLNLREQRASVKTKEEQVE